MELWHKRLGHMSQKGLAMLCNVNKLDVQGKNLEACNDCKYGMSVKCSYYSSVARKSYVLDLVYMNVWSLPNMSIGGANHYVFFFYDHSRMI